MLDPDEPAPFEICNEGGTSALFLICDHASRRLPRRLGTLGLDEESLSAHVAWDIGAGDLARRLSVVLDAPLVLSGYSRLAIDCNRPFSSPTSIPELTCGIRVPGNEGLSEVERTARQEALFWPYHRTVERMLAGRAMSILLSVHSFTPSLYGKDRPWHFGVLYGKDRRFAEHMIEGLRGLDRWGGVVVGDNEPYRVTDESDFGVPMYAERANRHGLLLEVRQDLLATASDVEDMAELLAPALRGVVTKLSV